VRILQKNRKDIKMS